MTKQPVTLIVGGVAGGATAAARLSRLDSGRRIVIIERGAHVSFANCGLPYYIGGVIEEKKSLLLASPELFLERYGIEVLTRHEALAIHPESSTLEVMNLETGETVTMAYDELVLAPGAAPFRPPMPGIDLPGVMTLRNVPDAEKMRDLVRRGGVRRALIIGAGFIGLEVAENLCLQGVEVELVEGGRHVLPPLDAPMSAYVEQVLRREGVHVETNRLVRGLRRTDNGALQAYSEGWESREADMVLLSIGVRPETELARSAGIRLGTAGAILVDTQMRTSIPGIWAVGDAVEVRSRVTGKAMTLALAGVAQKQARIAAGSIAGRREEFHSVLGTGVLRVFGTTAAMTGMNPEGLARMGYDDEWEYVDAHPFQHVTYYPGAENIHMRLVYRVRDGLILGASAVGTDGAARRIDVIAALMGKGGTVYDLEEVELCYSPQEGAAKDAANLMGMMAANHLRGLHPVAHVEDIGHPGTFLLDVREEAEVARTPYPGAVNIPLSRLRQRWRELPKDRDILVFCQMGARAYNAVRYLNNQGLTARNITGGYLTMSLVLNRR